MLEERKYMKKFIAVLTVLIGVAVIVLGVNLTGKGNAHSVYGDTLRYSAADYSVDSVTFGADYYTYTYKANRVMVEELNDLNQAMEVLVKAGNNVQNAVAVNVRATDDLSKTIYEVGGMIVIAMGLGILVYGGQSLTVAFPGKQKVIAAPVAAVPFCPPQPQAEEEMTPAEE